MVFSTSTCMGTMPSAWSSYLSVQAGRPRGSVGRPCPVAEDVVGAQRVVPVAPFLFQTVVGVDSRPVVGGRAVGDAAVGGGDQAGGLVAAVTRGRRCCPVSLDRVAYASF